MGKREVDIVVISDVHLGTYGCHAKELLQYLKTIRPKALVLNGDIIDIWQFSKRYWPATQAQAIDLGTRKKDAENPKALMALLIEELHLPGNDHRPTKADRANHIRA